MAAVFTGETGLNVSSSNGSRSGQSVFAVIAAFGALLVIGGCHHHHRAQTYSLGGTVSGLGNSAGLVLANGSSTVAVNAGATSFTISTGLSSGTTYAVSVQTQPAGETCTVAGGTGTISTANVANVVVTCSDQAYPLGGTISGLGNNSGLVLANGTDTLSVSAGATTFTLPTDVAYTSSYAVTVQTQPTGLACAVRNGTGTMPASAVTNVAVACTDQPFTVGGSISGLGSNTGLVLMNGADTLTVSAGATTFTMPTSVAFGGAYAVTVQTNPAGLTCSVSNGSGTMLAANVTNVAISCSDQSYSIGGTISGLTGTGLILANGSDTLAVSSGATGFTLPTNVAYTSSYAVTVQTQPSGEICTVTNGSGTMGAGNVTNVSVTCAPITYTIGGTISGLTASGLVLLNNGSDATTIHANATQFTMNTGVTTGGSYAITVQTQPTGATCTVASGTGTVGAADVTSVAVSCVPGTSYTTTTLYTFGTTAGDGRASQAALILGSDGIFYGTSYYGGAHGDGAVFKLTPGGSETVLYSFAGSDGQYPEASLVQGSDGNFYGTTGAGGANNIGTVFKLTPSGSETVVYSFAGGADGSTPAAQLIQGSDGNFYGTTVAGGASNNGTVFKITPGGTETVLYSIMGGNDGANPQAGVLQGSDGNFYGTTSVSGVHNAGTVFKVTPGGTETILYSFAGGNDGLDPVGSLIQGSDGNFYGTTLLGGTSNVGTVFKITPSGAETVLYSFAGSDGAYPYAALFQGSDGNFYGTTNSGGTSNIGTVFRITPSGTETTLHSFTGGNDGGYPYGPLILGSDGSFYGTTYSYGSHSNGTVFKVTPQ